MRTGLPLLILVAISLIPTEVGAESITYNIVNYPDLQNGYTVSGTITTNGATGTELPGTDITSWDITVSLGTTTITTINTTNSTNGTQAFTATPTTIVSQFISGFVEDIHFFTPAPTSSIEWLSNSFLAGSLYIGVSNNQTLWNSGAPNSAPVITVAVLVPEPSSAVLASIGAVAAFLAYGWSRHRRAQRRQVAA